MVHFSSSFVWHLSIWILDLMDYVLLKIWIFDGLCYLLKTWIFVLMDFVLCERYGYYDFCCFIWNMNVLFAVKRKKEIEDERNECIISSCGVY